MLGRDFDDVQLGWLGTMRDEITASRKALTLDHLRYGAFAMRGGLDTATRVFGRRTLGDVVASLNTALAGAKMCGCGGTCGTCKRPPGGSSHEHGDAHASAQAGPAKPRGRSKTHVIDAEEDRYVWLARFEVSKFQVDTGFEFDPWSLLQDALPQALEGEIEGEVLEALPYNRRTRRYAWIARLAVSRDHVDAGFEVDPWGLLRSALPHADEHEIDGKILEVREPPDSDDDALVRAVDLLVATLPRPDMAALREHTRRHKVPRGSLAVVPLDPDEAATEAPEHRFTLALHLPDGRGLMFRLDNHAPLTAADFGPNGITYPWGDANDPDTEVVILARGLTWSGIAYLLDLDVAAIRPQGAEGL